MHGFLQVTVQVLNCYKYAMKGEKMKLVFLETNSLGDDISLEEFSRYGEVAYYPSSTPEETRERVKDADVVFSNKIPMNEATLGAAEKLRYIGITATGTNNVDMEYAKQRGFAVTNVAGYSTDSVAQHTIAMVLYLLEKLRYFDDFVKSGDYSRSSLFCYYGEKFWELNGKTWGIIGLGAIGRKVAQIAKAFGCRVIYYSTSGRNSNPDFEQTDLDTLLTESDVVSVHAPLNEKTEGMMNYEAFCKMKKSSIFINVGRGPIVNEEDLCRALKEDQIAAAGLDVMEKEPLPAASPLLSLQDSRKLFLTPHVAWASVEARKKLVQELAENLDAYLKGEERNRVV